MQNLNYYLTNVQPKTEPIHKIIIRKTKQMSVNFLQNLFAKIGLKKIKISNPNIANLPEYMQRDIGMSAPDIRQQSLKDSKMQHKIAYSQLWL